MHLVFLESAEENELVRDAAPELDASLDAFWIGASDAGEEGQWRWVDDDQNQGELFWSGQAANAGGMAVDDAYSNWAGGRPDHGAGDEDCVMMTLDRGDFPAGSWDDDPCGRQAPFVCESR